MTNDGTVALGVEKLDGNGHRSADTSALAGGERRRSLYLQVRRTRPLGILEVFDAPSLTPNCDARNASTVSTQSLYLLNDAFVLQSADALAQRAGPATGATASRIGRAWAHAFGVEPPEAQRERFTAYVVDQSRALFVAAAAEGKKPGGSTEDRALATYCQALLASNQFLYVD
jgi:hypothetical protein